MLPKEYITLLIKYFSLNKHKEVFNSQKLISFEDFIIWSLMNNKNICFVNLLKEMNNIELKFDKK